MEYYETDSFDPCRNLAAEEYLLKNRCVGDILMLWRNDKTVVIGLNQNAAEEANLGFLSEHGIRLVRRKTGGGAVYHDLGNLNYSYISDWDETQGLSMDRFTVPLCRALAELGLDARASGRNDITVAGKKVSGAAQRLYGRRILHHGTLLFDSDLSMLSGALKVSRDKFRSKSVKSVRGRVGNIRSMLPEDMDTERFMAQIRLSLVGNSSQPAAFLPTELAEIERLEKEYASWEWNYGGSPQYTLQSRRRYDAGSVEVSLEVKDGIISAASFHGDFMAVTPPDKAERALCGVKFSREDVGNALSKLELGLMFGGLSAENILNCIFD